MGSCFSGSFPAVRQQQWTHAAFRRPGLSLFVLRLVFVVAIFGLTAEPNPERRIVASDGDAPQPLTLMSPFKAPV
jgi:hypothetical protein